MRGTARAVPALVLSLACASLASSGCGGEGEVALAQASGQAGASMGNHAGAPGHAGSGGSAGQSASGGAGGAAGAAGAGGAKGPVKRTVETRNPFGNTAVSANLMADGDFELTGRHSQMPWLSLDTSGQVTLDFETGGRCRSGVRCGRIGQGKAFYGFMASPRQEKMHVSLWVKPSGESCAELGVYVADLNKQSAAVATIKSLTDGPDASGWCHFDGLAANLAGKSPILVLDPTKAAQGDIVVDDVVVLPAEPTGGAASKIAAAQLAAAPDRLAHDLSWIAAHRPLGLARAWPEVPAKMRPSY